MSILKIEPGAINANADFSLGSLSVVGNVSIGAATIAENNSGDLAFTTVNGSFDITANTVNFLNTVAVTEIAPGGSIGTGGGGGYTGSVGYTGSASTIVDFSVYSGIFPSIFVDGNSATDTTYDGTVWKAGTTSAGRGYEQGGMTWDATTGNVTVPQTGLYQVALTAYHTNSGGEAHNQRFFLRKNGANYISPFSHVGMDSVSTLQHTVIATINLAANDTISIAGDTTATWRPRIYGGSGHTYLQVVKISQVGYTGSAGQVQYAPGTAVPYILTKTNSAQQSVSSGSQVLINLNTVVAGSAELDNGTDGFSIPRSGVYIVDVQYLANNSTHVDTTEIHARIFVNGTQRYSFFESAPAFGFNKSLSGSAPLNLNAADVVKVYFWAFNDTLIVSASSCVATVTEMLPPSAGYTGSIGSIGYTGSTSEATTVTVSPAFKGALLSVNGTMNLPAATYTTVTTLGTVVYDTNNFASVSNQLTIPAGVSKVKLSAAMIGASQTEQFILIIIKNGQTTYTSAHDGDTAGADGVVAITPVIPVVAGDYFQLQAYSTLARTTSATPETSWFAIEVVEGSILDTTGVIRTTGYTGSIGYTGSRGAYDAVGFTGSAGTGGGGGLSASQIYGLSTVFGFGG